jgi:hypothetical protein
VRSYGSPIFNYFRNFHVDFHSDWTIYIPTGCKQGFPLQESSAAFVVYFLSGVRWDLRIILTCIPLVAKDDEHSFHVGMGRCTSSFVLLHLFSSIAHLLIGLLILLVLNF